MNLAQFIADYYRSQSFNHFYCSMKSISLDNLNYLKSSKANLAPSAKVIAFGRTQFGFISPKIKNSISQAVVVSPKSDSKIFEEFITEWLRKRKERNRRSLFFKKVFKALLLQKIKVVTNSTHTVQFTKYTKKKNQAVSQRYVWSAIGEPSIILSYFKNKKILESSSVSKKFLFDQLSASPVFVVKNGFNEIILGHPLSRIKRSSITTAYLNWLNRSNPQYPRSTGLFFFHPDDAFEFKDFITSINPVAAKHLEIDVEPVGLHFAYKMTRNPSSGTQFSFVPDFKEVGDLLFKHRKNKHLVFHKYQRYGKNFFQGQPIYMIQPINLIDQHGNHSIIKFTGLNDDREVIFTSIEAANRSWTNFVKNNSQLESIKQPSLLVYNLESFLKDQERLHSENFQKFVLITNKQAYLATKEFTAVNYSNSLSKYLKLNIKPKLFFVKLWGRRLLSTLTYE